ncbi:hypothetical protein B0H16DRAFT_1589028 [Mycena metata]|uniref:Uncharacterized protein n=1 Tax=Mycena metata TaxID=1033252 RepID=A0AAD7MS45_9AGAR|nr:hypothetical protein B0H16DRAFT_1638801 [Mycena metata]KAJ7728341.1 hypothetical protein B0H16DRAFT_1589028 [Mycena metata]
MSSSQSGVGTKVYQYALAGAIGAVFFIALGLCWRARILERRARARRLLFPPPVEQIQEKPCLYDAYLESDDHGVSWHEVMPLALSQYGAGPQTAVPSKPGTVDVDPLISALSRVALVIAMPSPYPLHHPPSDSLSDLEEGHGVPYVELGVLDVEVHEEIVQP